MKSHRGKIGTKHAGLALLASAAFVAVLPNAFAAASDTAIAERLQTGVLSVGSDGLGAFTPSSVDPRLLERLNTAPAASNSATDIFRFTPAGAKQHGDRAVTVAVRVDADTARAISIRPLAVAVNDAGRGTAIASISPVAFNLGVARGFQSFASNRPDTVGGWTGSNSTAELAPAAGRSLTTGRALNLPGEVRKLDMPDLSSFTPSKSKPGRFSATVDLDDAELPGSTPRTITGEGNVSVDVAGAYRVAKNLKVTAGLRYSADNNRIAPLTDEHDSQAVYVGTQFQF